MTTKIRQQYLCPFEPNDCFTRAEETGYRSLGQLGPDEMTCPYRGTCKVYESFGPHAHLKIREGIREFERWGTI